MIMKILQYFFLLLFFLELILDYFINVITFFENKSYLSLSGAKLRDKTKSHFRLCIMFLLFCFILTKKAKKPP